MADGERLQRGREMRRALMGDEYAERIDRTVYGDPMMRTFIDVAAENIFGSLWTRPGLDLKTRTLICVVSDAATGRPEELALHLQMALRQGWTRDELTEVLIHLLGYVGAPLDREAMLTARKVFAEFKG
jgi:4-carboxymuconolactone decarboxylase